MQNASYDQVTYKCVFAVLRAAVTAAAQAPGHQAALLQIPGLLRAHLAHQTLQDLHVPVALIRNMPRKSNVVVLCFVKVQHLTKQLLSSSQVYIK